MEEKLEKLLNLLYAKQDKQELPQYEQGMKDILSAIIDEEESIIDEFIADLQE